MVAYTLPQQRKKEESERLREERDHIKFIDLEFERWQVERFRKCCVICSVLITSHQALTYEIFYSASSILLCLVFFQNEGRETLFALRQKTMYIRFEQYSVEPYPHRR